MSDTLTDLQTIPAAYLTADAYISDAASGTPKAIRVVTEDIGDIATAVQTAVTKLGIVIMVMTPECPPYKSEATPPLAQPKIVCTVVEDVTINRHTPAGTGQRVGKVAAHIAAVLHMNPDLGLWLIWKGIFLNSVFKGRAARDVVFEIENPVRLPAQTR